MMWLLSVVLLLLAAQAAAGDPASGRAVAEGWCAECHEIEPGIRDEWPCDPPALQTLVDHRATTEMSLRAFLQSPHASMPQVMPTPDQTDDLIAYILSLRGRPPGA